MYALSVSITFVTFITININQIGIRTHDLLTPSPYRPLLDSKPSALLSFFFPFMYIPAQHKSRIPL
jgi:hypothetical protein